MMEITWNTTMNQIIDALNLGSRPWMIDAFTEMDTAETLEGRQMGQVPLGELAERGMIQGRPSVVSGFQFLMDAAGKGNCLHDIWEDDSKNHTGLFAFPVPGAKKFLLIIPGGGYFNVCSFIEGFPIAQRCTELGISAFILKYRCNADAHFPNPQEDAAQAVRYILANAERFGLGGTDYAVCGFSAGGHLAASFGTEALGYGRFGVPAPQAEILGYPVITMHELTHEGTRHFLLAEQEADPVAREYWSVENQVTASYPPTFVWNCEADDLVPAQNSLMLEAVLKAAGVPVKHEVFPGTVHGWGLADGTPAANWLDRGIAFWMENC